MPAPKASPAIWKKLTAQQKRWYRMFYLDMICEWGISDKKLTKKEKHVIAHNHALLAVWAFSGIKARMMRNHANTV